jgi:signal transduction histidine kinase
MADWRVLTRWTFAGTLFIILALLPLVVRLPEPDALRIDQAQFSMNGSPPSLVRLPHAWTRAAPGKAIGEYRMIFSRPDGEPKPLYLLVAHARLDMTFALNGRELDFDRANAWASPFARAAILAPLPAETLHSGENELTIRLTRADGIRPGYLSAIFIGDRAQILPNFQLRDFIFSKLRITILILAVMMAVGFAVIYSIRKRDYIHGWFFLLAVGGALLNLIDLGPSGVISDSTRAMLSIAVSNVIGMAFFGLSLTIAERTRPRWLLPLALIWPCLAFAALSLPFRSMAFMALFAVITWCWLCASIVVLLRNYRATRNAESGMLAAAILLAGVYGATDILTISGIADRGFLLMPYPQVILLFAIGFILFRRLAVSMNRLDGANETLRRSLAEREAELAQAHAQERQLAAEVAREQERQRLMRDLHDGLSGHVVSIIALAERDRNIDIEQMARETLADLRLVIQSLDIGVEDISAVLAYFWEKVAPQLRRLNIELDWSMDQLPTITGMSPSHALALLRILQEAVTNAVRHGPARRISIRGGASGEAATITVENDGGAISEVIAGNGLRNMANRARSLAGKLSVTPTGNGLRVILVLPRALPPVKA